ncbi:response regulator [Methylopila sp. Yamaguchi]|uniref:response regulator n=1 Tax=Methylopila sp. Yamaguchi TaxID=1437817 RepID=UPI000CC22728|nr:response regulator transcription factor [Methylopila sp. Yamaguchi]GBD48480.1 response regulator receiver protein [Methylopila sp. Yamaguchi]
MLNSFESVDPKPRRRGGAGDFDRAPRPDASRAVPAGGRLKVVIADDHWMVRQSLKQVMQRLEQTIEIYEAESFAEAAETLERHPDVDLMLVDLVMPGFEAFAGLRRLRKEFPTVPLVVVSVHEDVEHVMRSVEHGVIGYIPKSAGAPEVERALERVLAGEVSFPRRIIERSAPGAPAAATPEPASDGPALTEREREVMELLGRGASVRKIAEACGVAEQTVRVHLRNAMKKLNLPDRSAALHYAMSLFGGANPGRG